MTPPAVAAAVAATADGATLAIEARAGRRHARFPAGLDAWRGRLLADVAAPPAGGQANAELLGLVQRFFGLGPGRVEILSGATGRRKRVLLHGVSPDAAVARLAEALP